MSGERKAARLSLSQVEILLLVAKGRKSFAARDARSADKLVSLDLITGTFDLSTPDPHRGRVYEIWRNCALTAEGEAACAALRDRFAPLVQS